MKLPNGYGSVYKLPGKRRRPWAVAKTVGFDEDGKQKREIIGYTATKEEGLKLLADYNNSPWNVKNHDKTFKEVFEIWKRHNKLSDSTKRSYVSKYRTYCQNLNDIPYKDLRTFHFNEIIENCDKSNGTKNIIRKLFRALDKTAMEYDIINKGYSEFIPTLQEDSIERNIFTEEEIKVLWEHSEEPDVDIVLMYLYTGFRRQELADVKLENINLENWTIKGGSKTEAGKNRLVPIHPKIRPLVENRMKQSTSGKLFNITAKTIAEHFRNCMSRMGMKHIMHECRHTLRTRLDNAGGNRKCIDLIMGHASEGTGEKVYTHKTIQQLHDTILLIE